MSAHTILWIVILFVTLTTFLGVMQRRNENQVLTDLKTELHLLEIQRPETEKWGIALKGEIEGTTATFLYFLNLNEVQPRSTAPPSFFRIRIDSPLKIAFDVQQRSFLTKSLENMGVSRQEIQTGNRAFDQEYLLQYEKGTEPESVRKFILEPAAQQAMRSLFSRGINCLSSKDGMLEARIDFWDKILKWVTPQSVRDIVTALKKLALEEEA